MKNIFLALLLVMVSCRAKETIEENKKESYTELKESEKKKEVFDGISSATNPNEIWFNGIIEIPPQFQASVTLLMGGRIKNTSLLSGKYVQKGELLATVENLDFIDLQQSFLESDAQVEFLETEYQRQQVLVNEEVASRKKLQQSKADYLAMKSRRDASFSQLTLLGVDPSQIRKSGILLVQEVRSPIDGYVTNVQINIGKIIDPQAILCDVINKSNPILNLTVYERDIHRIKTGNRIEFKVNSFDDESYFGEVSHIGQAVDEINRSLSVYVKIEKCNPAFRPGMYVNAKIVQ